MVFNPREYATQSFQCALHDFLRIENSGCQVNLRREISEMFCQLEPINLLYGDGLIDSVINEVDLDSFIGNDTRSDASRPLLLKPRTIDLVVEDLRGASSLQLSLTDNRNESTKSFGRQRLLSDSLL